MSRSALRVAVDLVFYTWCKGGTESYARGLFTELASHDDLRLVGFGNRELAVEPLAWLPGEIVPLLVSGENRAAWAAAVAMAVGPCARGIGADVLHCPSNVGPVLRLLPTVVTVHDILPIRHPAWVPDGRSRGVRAVTGATVRAADRIITVSHASAADLHEWLGRPLTDIDVIHLGVDPVDPLARSPGPDRPYLLAGGNRMPHKNFDPLIEAWALIPAAERPNSSSPAATAPTRCCWWCAGSASGRTST